LGGSLQRYLKIGLGKVGFDDIPPLAYLTERRIDVGHEAWCWFTVLSDLAKGCHETMATIWLLNEEGWVDIFYVDAMIFRLAEDTHSFKLVELMLKLHKLIPVVKWNATLPLWGKAVCNVYGSLDVTRMSVIAGKAVGENMLEVMVQRPVAIGPAAKLCVLVWIDRHKVDIRWGMRLDGLM
jgi:hypothetical protein